VNYHSGDFRGNLCGHDFMKAEWRIFVKGYSCRKFFKNRRAADLAAAVGKSLRTGIDFSAGK
jgi:hypothetical protein